MSTEFVFVDHQAAQASVRQKPKLSRRRGACENCKRRKVRCSGANPCEQCLKVNVHCWYIGNNQSRRRSVPNSGADKNNQQGDTDRHNGARLGLESFGHLHFFSESFLDAQSIPMDQPPGSSPVMDFDPYDYDASPLSMSNEQTALIDWDQLEATSNYVALGISANSGNNFIADQCFSETRTATNRASKDPLNGGCHNTLHTGEFTHDSRTVDELLNDSIPLAFAASTKSSLSFDYVRSSLHSWLLTAMTELDGDENRHILQTFERLLNANSPVIRHPSLNEDVNSIEILNSLRSESSQNRALVYRCIDACFSNPNRVGIFLDRMTVEELVCQVLAHPFVSSPISIALCLSFLAVGSRDLSLDDDCREMNAMNLFRTALYIRPNPSSGPSLWTFQALLLMAHFSCDIGAESTTSLMTDTATCVQALRLHSSAAISNLCSSDSERVNLKRAFWTFFAVEKLHCIQEGLFPLIHGEYADHKVAAPQDPLCRRYDCLYSDVGYAKICSKILQQLQGQQDISQVGSSCCGRESYKQSPAFTANRLETMLMEWKGNLPFDGDGKNIFTATSPGERRIRLTCINMYHFAMIAIHSLPGVEDTDASKRQRCESAREILDMSEHITSADLLYDWSVPPLCPDC
uniref:AAl-toxin cluster-specific transcription factor ALT13 n=1 Tax=Alternaria alternata TaxID=5599 RepID=ALT13_ALTAL|nr:RecName: Full=AAl-toxin cluster-specific transcription factor ALT13; AltName: Full=AAL-toxin biosynthesis cluster protein 13 [Alternaria alternata]BBG74281.1 Zn(II)2Cys6 transcription factor [Alternaria alternata]